jgi:hypothetical protein
MVLPKIRDFILSWGVEHGINTADVADIISSINVLQPDVHDNYSGAIPITIASNTFWSGTSVNTSGETHNARCDAMANQQDTMTQPSIYRIDSVVPIGINTSGTLSYSGACQSTYGNSTGADENGVNPDRQGTSGEVTISTYTSSTITIQTSGIGNNIHVESMDLGLTLPISQATSHYYVPPSPITPVYFYRQFTPVPNELIGPYGWISIKKMDWKQSTPFLGWLFEQLGYKVPRRPKSHDQGGDILLERYGEKIAIQVKHRKENTGRKALEEALYAKEMHGATKARVISFSSPFTKEALNDVKKSKIELWDLERVIAEMHKNNIYYPID